jgi:hypothetical protein
MKIKTLLLSITLVASIANAGFFSHDKAYYDKHIDEAKAKLKECDKAMQHALIDENIEKIKEIDQDQECKDAKASVKEYRKAKRKIEAYKRKQEWEKEQKEREAKRKAAREAQAKKEAEELKKKQAAFDAEYQTQLATLQGASFDVIYKAKRECRFGVGDALSKKAARCKVVAKLEKEKEAQALDEMIKSVQKEKFLDFKEKTCQKDFTSGSCYLANKVFESMVKKQVDTYVKNKDLLKEDFNECQKNFTNYQRHSKFKEAQALKKTFKCYTAAKAAEKFNVFGFFTPMK